MNCINCETELTRHNTDMWQEILDVPLLTMCKKCSDLHLVEDIDCVCSVKTCKKKKKSSEFSHYRTRFKANGMRLRVNTNCLECTKKEAKVRSDLKKDAKKHKPEYGVSCPQCNKVCYEKSEDIPEGVDGTNGPWQMDHCHDTGAFRGYLCKRCNTGTGLIGDNEEYWTIAKKRQLMEECFE